MHKILEGIRVLEWGIFHAGPAGGAILADMGAEVIKIEQPGTGDAARQGRRYKGIDFSFGEDGNLFYEGANRGKKGITLDVASEQGLEIAYRLVEQSDVFLTNLRPETIRKMKMDYPRLVKQRPDLIYASVTLYGSKGPDANRGGFDYQGQAKSGFMHNIGEPGMPPLLAQFGIIDQTTAIMGSYQVVAALLMRERFGIGQEVEVSLLGSASYLMYLNNLTTLVTGRQVPRHERATADPLRNTYQCQDGRWLVQTQVPNQEKWKVLCNLLGLPELVDDPRYDTRDKRLDTSEELVSILDKAFLEKPRDEWVRLFNENDLSVSPANTTLEAVQDPQMSANEYVVDYDHPELGKMRIPGFPIRFSQAEVNNNLRAPKLGEHTDQVLKDIAGYTEEEVDRFRREEVI